MDKCPYCEKEIADVAKELIIQESDAQIDGARLGMLIIYFDLICPHCNQEIDAKVETEPNFSLYRKG